MTKEIKYPTKYVVWDLETDGLDPEHNHILEFAALMIEDGKIVEEYTAIINHDIDIPQFITDINGHSREKCAKEGILPLDALKEMVRIFSRYKNTVTHNGHRFDIPFIVNFISSFKVQLSNGGVESLTFLDITEDSLRRYCVDTAGLFKAQALKMPRHWNESFAGYVKRALDTRVAGLKFNVGFCCDILGIDRTKVELHRAGGDVMLTNEIYKKLCL